MSLLDGWTRSPYNLFDSGAISSTMYATDLEKSRSQLARRRRMRWVAGLLALVVGVIFIIALVVTQTDKVRECPRDRAARRKS